MNIIYIIFFLLFCVLIIIGIVIWSKQKITWVYNYNKRSIKDEDIKGYTKSVGIVYIIAGISLIPLVLLDITNKDNFKYVGFLIWFVGFIIIRVINFKTKKKYNIGIFN